MNGMVHIVRVLAVILSITALGCEAQSWSFSDATLAVGPKSKDATSSFTFGPNSVVEDVFELSPVDTLRLEFTTKNGDKTARPHQSFVLIEDPSANLEISVPVPVKPSGKAKLDLDHRDLPPQFLFADTLKLTLIIASFGDSAPMKVQFASVKPITNESSATKPQPPERWGPKPEITHTFKQPQKLPNIILSAIFAFAVAAGLPLFLVLLVLASANISSFGEAFSNARLAHAGFFASLLMFELRFFRYWREGTLGEILIESVAIGIVAFMTGRRALGEVMARRSQKA